MFKNKPTNHHTYSKLIAVCLSVILGLSTLPFYATAKPISQLQSERADVVQELADAQNELDAAADKYDMVLQEKEAADASAQQAAQEVEQLDAEIDKIQERLSARVTDMYRNNEVNLFITVLLGSKTLGEMLDNWNAFIAMNEKDQNAVQQSKKLRQEASLKQLEAEEMSMLALQKAEEAQAIKDNAQTKVDEFNNTVNSIDESIRQETLAEAARQAAARVQADNTARSGAAASIPTNGGVIEYAQSRLGCPYVFGAAGPNYFDCSGLVMWCYAQTGKSLPHNSEALKNSAAAIIPVSEAQPGDVLYRPGHVGICTVAGGGEYIHAPHTGDVVRYASGSRWSCALRF